MKPLAVLATGMMTGVGLDAPSSCAAIRCAIDRFEETRFMDKGGEWIIASTVPLDPPLRGRAKVLRMALSVIRECLEAVPDFTLTDVPVFLCVAERDRPGRLDGLDSSLLQDISEELGQPLHRESRIIANGRVGGVQAVQLASQAIDHGGVKACLIAGVDGFLHAKTLASYEERLRLLTSQNSNGFIPGEGAAAVLLGQPQKEQSQLICRGIGFGKEEATVESEQPLRADGLAAAFRAALADAGCTFDDVDYRLTDCNGEQYGFKEAALAIARTMKKVKPEFDIWHPADCIGEVGAASVPAVFATAKSAADKSYSPGPGVLCHFGNDDGARAALVLNFSNKGSK